MVQKPARRLLASMRALQMRLKDDEGSITEAVVGVILTVIIASMLALGATSDLNVVAVSTATAERQNAADAIVQQRNSTQQWGTAASPKTKQVTLSSGTQAPVTLWSVPTATGTTYYASVPRTGNVSNPAACTTSAAADSGNCIVETSFQAVTIAGLTPTPIVRKDPSGVGTTGTVNADVTTSTAIPQQGVIASFTPPATPATTTWRYLIKAQDSEGAGGEINLMQNGNVLASVPTDGTMQNYFGTVVAQAGVAVQVVAADDANIVNTILIYQAG